MATIIKKIKKGRPYYYAVESGRVNGQPRITWQKYLGTIDAIIQRTDNAKPPKPKEAVLSEAGGVAALLCIAQRLDMVKLIDAVVPKRNQGPSIGQYMLLAAINRALEPCSKVGIGDWYQETILRRLWGVPRSSFSSQRFWDHMDMISEKAIEQIQGELALRVADQFGYDGHILLYDTTNFFTFLATTNERNRVAQRGRNKAKRHDLRQVGLALLVTRDHQVPLFHKVYQGNIPDVSLFPKLARSIIRRCNRTLSPRGEATLVFDKGNVSDDGMEQLVVSTQHFVAALPCNRLPDLVGRSLEQFHGVDGVPGTKAFSEDLIWWGKSCKAVVAYTESFFTQQLCGVTRNLARCQKKLLDLDKNLAKWRKGNGRGKRPTSKQVERSVASILSPQFMKDVFRVRVEVDASLPRLSYELDHTSFDKLTHQRLGRTLLITDQIEWSNKEVIEAYRSLTNVEEAFKNMKNVDFLRWQPAHHWTDQKTMVHGFYCVLALLLTTLARKLVLQAGIDLSLPALLKDLTSIREVAVIYPSGTLAHRKDHVTLSRMSPRQRKLANILKIGEVIRG